MSLPSDVLALPPDELLALKARIINDRDKKKYAKEVLSSLDKEDAVKTINWIKERYGIT